VRPCGWDRARDGLAGAGACLQLQHAVASSPCVPRRPPAQSEYCGGDSRLAKGDPFPSDSPRHAGSTSSHTVLQKFPKPSVKSVSSRVCEAFLMSLCLIQLRFSHTEQTANPFQRVMRQTDPKPGARHVLLCRCVQAESFPTVPLSGRHTEGRSRR